MSNSCPHSDPRPRPVPRALAALPVWVPPLVSVVLVVAAALVRGPAGAALLGLVTLGLLASTMVGWRGLDLVAKVARGAVLLALVAGAVVLAVPR